MNEKRAFDILRAAKFRRDMFGKIYPPCNEHVETAEETEAINYLCDEWDYQYFWYIEK
jgi:hypothetical protein